MPKDIPSLPEKYPRKVTTGKSMDYSDSTLAFPKPKKKTKKKGWKK